MHNELIPNYFVDYAINGYAGGAKWIDDLSKKDGLIDKYIKKLELENIKLPGHITMNLVLSAHSNSLDKDVFVKFGNPGANTDNEINYLRAIEQFKDTREIFANTLLIDDDDRIIILEALKPAEPLSIIDDKSDRVRILCDMAKKTSLPITESMTFSSFRDEMHDKFNTVLVDNASDANRYDEIKEITENAQDFYKDIDKMGFDNIVIHGDLHCRNVLSNDRDSYTEWRIIDPLAIISEEIFSTCKFASHELVEGEMSENIFDELVDLIVSEMEYDKEDYLKALYIDVFDWLEFLARTGAAPDDAKKLMHIENMIIDEIR